MFQYAWGWRYASAQTKTIVFIFHVNGNWIRAMALSLDGIIPQMKYTMTDAASLQDNTLWFASTDEVNMVGEMLILKLMETDIATIL